MIQGSSLFKLIRKIEWLEWNRSGQGDTQFLIVMLLYTMTILAGFFLFFLIWYLGDILTELNQASEGQVSLWINKYIFFYFSAEFYLRFFTQKAPSRAVEKYLVWPVRKKQLAMFAIIKSLWGAPLFFLLIFSLTATFRYVVPENGYVSGFAWFITVVSVSALIHVFMIWMKVAQRDMTLILISIIFIVASISILEKYTHLSVLTYTGILFYSLLKYPFLAVGPCLISAGAGMKIRVYLASQLNNPPSPSEYGYGWMDKSLGLGDRWGLPGSFAEIEWKLIIRHKRTRYYLFMSLLFLLYGVFYYSSHRGDEAFAVSNVLPALLLMTVFVNQYGGYFFNWNSAFFEFYLIQPHGLKALVYGKLYLFIALTLLTFILCLPYVYFGLPILFMHLSLALLTIGLLMYVFAGVGITQAFKIDLNKSGTVYGDDLGCMKVIVLVPVLLVPFGIYLPFKYYDVPEMGLAVIGGLGFLGFVFFPRWAKHLTHKALKRKYSLIETFNRKD